MRFIRQFNSKSEFRNPRAERNPKPEDPKRCEDSLLAKHFSDHGTEGIFGVRISTFFRISGTRISDFKFDNSPINISTRQAGFSLVELFITIVLVLILSALLLGRGMFSNQQRRLVNCQKNLQNIYLASSIYAADNRGNFPLLAGAQTAEPPLSLLVPRSTTVTEIFICPSSNDKKLPEGEPFAKRRISYAYYMGRVKTDGSGVALLSDRQVNTLPKITRQQIFSENGKEPGANHSRAGGNFLFCDGEFRKEKPRASREYLFPTNVVLLNPKP